MKINWADVVGFLTIWVGTIALFRTTTNYWVTFFGIIVVTVGCALMDYAHDKRKDEE